MMPQDNMTAPSPADTATPRVRSGDVHLATGVRLRFREQGDPAGHAVILLHGYSDSWFSYSRVLPLLPAEHHVYALDLRGHGDSDRPASGYAARDLARDVLAFMDAKGLARATVVGHSGGSLVAQQTALLAPGRVAGLVLVGSARSVRGMEGFEEFRRTVESLEEPVPVEFVREFQESTVHRPLPAGFMDRVIEESLKLPARVWRAYMEGMAATDPASGLAGKRIPTLVLWGDRDAVFPRAEQDALLALLPGADFKVYPETGHAPHWERPEEFARDLRDFLGGIAAR